MRLIHPRPKYEWGRILIFLVAVAALFVVFYPHKASAFKPDDQGHLGITSDALRAMRITDPAGGQPLVFTDAALNEIRAANRAIDVNALGLPSSTFFVAEDHCDNESLAAASQRLLTLKESIISKITVPLSNGAGAREELGGALHTLQDFYAHSNWVELGNTSIHAKLGRQVLVEGTDFAGPDDIVCAPGDQGKLLPGLQKLTTGYFLGTFGDDPVPAGKCFHGVHFLGHNQRGINKDDPSTEEGLAYYTQARTLAVKASIDYVQQIVNDPRVAGNLKAIDALIGVDFRASVNGTWQSNEPGKRFKLQITGSSVIWTEQKSTGSSLRRTVSLSSADGRYRAERPNNDPELLAFLDFRPEIRQEILARTPKASYLLFSVQGDKLKGDWFGLSVRLNADGTFAELFQPGQKPPKQYEFTKLP